MNAEIKKYSKGGFEKIGDVLGRNPGGFFRNLETGEEFYVKFYHDQDQACCEYLANMVYSILDIPVPASRLIFFEKKLGICLKKVEIKRAVSYEELAQSGQFLEGFLADAYLDNYDVAGSDADNVVLDTQGRYVRMDNGSSLFFRATSGRKTVGSRYEYLEDSVPEIDEFRLESTNLAARVYSKAVISEEMLNSQTRKLLQVLTSEVIEKLTKLSNYSKQADMNRHLLGRREYLCKRLGQMS